MVFPCWHNQVKILSEDVVFSPASVLLREYLEWQVTFLCKRIQSLSQFSLLSP